MPIRLIVVLLLFCCTRASAQIVQVKLNDGEVLTGQLVLPTSTSQISKLVFFVHSTGPHTYADHRKSGNTEFNYFDLFAHEFSSRGIAFFSYSRRGVYPSESPPYYDSIDRKKYSRYLPSIEANDIVLAINQLLKDKRLKKAKVILLGWSEGSILAPMVAELKKAKVDALVLAGYANDNMIDLIKWQNSGESSMINIKGYFDTNDDSQISRLEYESDSKSAKAFRTQVFQNAKFESLDLNRDSTINQDDFRIINKPRLDAILSAFDRGDDEWIWKNYFRVTSLWLNEHKLLEPNSVRLPKLSIPIYIVHGALDANCPAAGVFEIRKQFESLGKRNLNTYVLPNHDHDLNYRDWVTKQKLSAGIEKIFELVQQID